MSDLREIVHSINITNKVFHDSYHGDVRLKIFFPFKLEAGTFSWIDEYNQKYVEDTVEKLKKIIINENNLFESFEQKNNEEGIHLYLKMSPNFNGINSKYEAFINNIHDKSKQEKQPYSIEEITKDLNKDYFIAKEFDTMFKMIYKNFSIHEMFEDFMPLFDDPECNLDDLNKQPHLKNKF